VREEPVRQFGCLGHETSLGANVTEIVTFAVPKVKPRHAPVRCTSSFAQGRGVANDDQRAQSDLVIRSSSARA
jgi:hypothetical protein